MTGSRAKRTGVTIETARQVLERAGGRCEGCKKPLNESFQGAPELHHRQLRSGGGGHEAVNLLVLHRRCHSWAHENPADARTCGWIVSRYDDPQNVAVIRREPL